MLEAPYKERKFAAQFVGLEAGGCDLLAFVGFFFTSNWLGWLFYCTGTGY